MLTRTLIVAAVVCAALTTVLPGYAQDVPASINYQGKLTDAIGKPVPDGTYQVQFKLYTVETAGTAFWTSAAVKVQTSGGVFTTQLTPVTPTTLDDQTDVWLEIVMDPLGAPETLSPRSKLTSAPFALRAGDLDLPYTESIDSASTAFKVTNIGGGAAITGHSSSNYGYLGGTDYGVYGFAKAGTEPYGVAGSNFSGGSFGYLGGVSQGVHGVTTSSDEGVQGTSSSTGYAIYGESSGTGDAVRGHTTGATGSNAGSFQISNDANTSPALFATSNGGGQAVFGSASGNGEAGYFQISNSASSANALVGFTNGSGIGLNAYNSGTGLGARIRTTTTANPSHALQATAAGTGSAGYFETTNTANNSDAVYAETDGTSTTLARAVYGLHSSSGNFGFLASGTYGVYGSVSGLSDAGVYGTSSGSNGYGVWGYASYDAAGSSNYGVRGGADGDYGRGGYFVATGANGRGVQGYANNTGASTNYGGHFTANGTYGIGIYSRGGASGYAAEFSGNVLIKDRGTGATVMELGTGLDYAEGFDVSEDSPAEPGTVLVIDERNPGKLAVSAQAYDHRVAGIVAGAKGLKSGVRLTAGGFDCDVALAGRVFCNVDATRAAVSPGDLLTTSATPGYAMKVTDHPRAQGAILGKAMEPLAKGSRGQILVLVTLQ